MGQAPRYDEVYYPRTDKRMISKIKFYYNFHNEGGNQYEFQGNDYQKKTFQANSVEESIE